MQMYFVYIFVSPIGYCYHMSAQLSEIEESCCSALACYSTRWRNGRRFLDLQWYPIFRWLWGQEKIIWKKKLYYVRFDTLHDYTKQPDSLWVTVLRLSVFPSSTSTSVGYSWSRIAIPWGLLQCNVNVNVFMFSYLKNFLGKVFFFLQNFGHVTVFAERYFLFLAAILKKHFKCPPPP